MKRYFSRIVVTLWIAGALMLGFCLRSHGQSAISGTLNLPVTGYQAPNADRVDSLNVDFNADMTSWVYFTRGTKTFRIPVLFAVESEGMTLVFCQGCWVKANGSKVQVQAQMLVWSQDNGLHMSLWVGSALYYKSKVFYVPDILVSGEWNVE